MKNDKALHGKLVIGSRRYQNSKFCLIPSRLAEEYKVVRSDYGVLPPTRLGLTLVPTNFSTI